MTTGTCKSLYQSIQPFHYIIFSLQDHKMLSILWDIIANYMKHCMANFTKSSGTTFCCRSRHGLQRVLTCVWLTLDGF